MDPEPTEQPTSAEAAEAAANFADFDFSQFMLSSSSDSNTAPPTQESSRQVYQSFHFPQSSPNTAVPHPSTTPRHSISLEQQQQQVHSSDAAAASEQDQLQLSAALQKGATTTSPLSSSAFDFSSLSQTDIEALTGGSYHTLDQLMNIPQPTLTNSSNIPSTTTIPAHQAQSGTLHTTTASALSPTTTIRSTSQHSPIQSTSPTTTKITQTNTDSTTFLHPSRSKRRRSVDPSAAGGRESSSLSTKPPFPFPRPGALKLPPASTSSASAMRSSLRAQAVAAAASSGMMEGQTSSNESNIGSSSSSSTSRSTVRSTLGMGLRVGSRVAAAGSRGMKTAQGSWESMTTIRSGGEGVGGGMSFGGAGASMKGGPGNSEEEDDGEDDGEGLVERGMMALPHGWVYVRLLDGRMTVPVELLARLQIPYSVLSSSSFSPNTIVPPHHHHHHGNPPTSPPLLPPTSSLRAFHSRVDTPSASPVALFAHTTSSARAPLPMSSSGPTSPLAQTVGGGVVAMEEGDEEVGETDVDEKLRGEGVDGDVDGDAEVGGEERRDEEGRMRFYALTKREVELLLHWLRFELVPKHVRADLDLLGLLADRYELRELIEAVRDAKDTRYMSIKERAEFDGKAVGEMQRHLGSLILWPDPRNNRPEDDTNANNSAAGGGPNPNPSTGGQGTVAATIAGPSYQAVCAVLDDDLWDLVPGTRKLVKVDFRFPLGMARQGAISPFGSDQMREMQGQPGWDSLASSSSGRQTLWNTYRDDANRQVWHRIFFDTVAKRLWTDGFVIEREMVDCISSKVFYLISR
ncbi:hypothetical protein A4X09_0g5291 [Tilletia walkeri]|uniref:Uncharacterized protein n=1 Tax=Tilletia walkeri TaxID=117179 RepID=A0A8X7N5N1_9BASI|nr:hypothetical protein A4X09_0g5291 [Tilletia walkeri]